MTLTDRDLPLALLEALIRRPSITPDDAACQDLIADRLSAAGFRCEHLPFGDVNNLWARFGDASPVLCFAGHTDVVPPGPADDWLTDPFNPVCVDGVLFGRGAADMKSGLAAMTIAATRFVREHPTPRGSLAFLITSDEEGPAVNGTRRVMETLADRGEHIDWCVIGEPSSSLTLGDTIRVGRRGSLYGRLTVKGIQGHVAYPDQVSNPVRQFAPALAALHAIQWDRGNDDFPPTSLEVTNLRSGIGASNVTPPDLFAEFNFRYSTEWTADALQQRVAELLDPYGFDYQIEWERSGEPFLTPEGTLTRCVAGAIEAVTGKAPCPSTGGGTSDGRFIAPHGTEVVEVGPVNASIHKANEYVDMADVERLTVIYNRIMTTLLLP
mgnify:FL=1